jgi:peptidyl-prolyl cis-trans isomerase SurA
MRRFVLLFALLLALPPAARAELISGIAAVVNDELITTYDLDSATAQLIKEAEKKGALPADARAGLRTAALGQLIDKKLVDQKIKELNIKVSEEDLRQAIDDIKKQNHLSQEALEAALRSQGMSFDKYKEQMREQLERVRLMSQEVRAKIQVGERECREYYETNRARYSGDERFHARHIFFRLKKDAPSDEIKQVMLKAMNVLQEARSGKDFVALVKQYSDDPAATTDGGDLGTFKRGEMLPEIEQTVTSMKVGEISDLVTTPAGIHVIKLEERIPGTLKPFEEVKAEIEDYLYRTKSEERFNQWLADLKKGAAIEVREGTSGDRGADKGQTPVTAH